MMIFRKWSIHSVFLCDAIGALVSSIFLLILYFKHTWFGMPQQVLLNLLPLTIIYTVYSLLCWAVVSKHLKRLLAIIAIANLVYAVLSLVLTIHFFSDLTFLGKAYFLLEILILLLLGIMELDKVIHNELGRNGAK